MSVSPDMRHAAYLRAVMPFALVSSEMTIHFHSSTGFFTYLPEH